MNDAAQGLGVDVGAGVALMTVTGVTVGGVGVPLGAGVAALCVTALTVRGVGPGGAGVALDCVTRVTLPEVGVPLGAGVAALWVTALTVGGVGVAGTGVAMEVVTGVTLAGVGVGVGVGVKAGSGTEDPGVSATVELVAADPIAKLATTVATMTKEKNASDAMRIGLSSEGASPRIIPRRASNSKALLPSPAGA